MPRWYTGRDVARAAYYDRDPIPTIGYFISTVAPHGNTIRISYSPAFPYAAFIETINTRMVRSTVAGTLNLTNGYWELQPFFGGSGVLITTNHPTNTAGAVVDASLAQLGYMAYGDILRFRTQDTSVGGTVEFFGSFKGTEFLY